MRINTPGIQGILGGQAGANIGRLPNGRDEGVEVDWGMYNHCLHVSTKSESLVCSDRKFGQRFNPADGLKLVAGITSVPASDLVDKVPIINQWDKLSKGGMYCLFLGTIFTGLAFLIACFFARPFTIIAAVLTFLGFALLLSGASIWTFMIRKLIKDEMPPFEYKYGNSLWFMCIASVASRRKYEEEY
ncbi:hypothetical protein MVES1_003935 [Malassezia vespertilionis]|uniref:uncharacterized protein n=1 Tax=Malassezia vespertilionis TaxID=2020962 RepID=UPI0024B09C23|nr:uncharacterized protein MVES1_003935 [Malassezia vespertilionis]WFD08559.1 hypothetical protein MVES1_003935 [Malassezia vespertilionis]